MGRNNGNSCDNLLLREIYKKLVSVEEEVEKLKSKPEYHISIEKLDVQHLENLTFALDSLDINDLSGTLNIGNNFGTKAACNTASKSKKGHKEKKARNEEEKS